MSQNLIELALSDDEVKSIGDALTTLEKALSGLIALDIEERRGLVRMGPKSEQFCRATLTTLEQNPQVVPPSLGLSDAKADLAAYDRLRPLALRLQQLAQKAEDTQIALGSDVMSLALEGYALLKVAGRNQALENLRRELGARFSKPSRQPTATKSAAAVL